MPAQPIDDILKRLSAEFVVAGAESIQDAERVVDAASAGRRPGAEAVREIARVAHSLKGQGGAFGFMNLTLVAHRLEDFLLNVNPERGDFWPDVLRYFDRMSRILDGDVPAERDTDKALADLPVASLFDGVLERQDIEVVLASEGATQNRVIRSELEACGFRVTVIASTPEALAYVSRVKPKLLLASAVMPVISGADLIRATKAMVATKDIACILATSSSEAVAGGLPKDVPIVRKGQHFSADIAGALQQVGLV